MRYSVVAPCYNAGPNLRELYRRLTAALAPLTDAYEIILVDDGSRDGSLAIMRDLAAADSHVRYLSLSRNFGQDAALAAGVDHAGGDAVILMDADLQDPPELIGQLVAAWQAGADEVHVVQRGRQGIGRLRRALTWLFYRLFRRFSGVRIPLDTCNFRLIDRRIACVLRRCRERGRFTRGLVAWAGYRSAAIEHHRPARFAGETSYSLLGLMRLAREGFTGFSLVPLRLASLGAACAAGLTVAAGLTIGVYRLVAGAGASASGLGLFTVGLFLLAGMGMGLLALVGEYLARVYGAVQRRPLYLVAEETPSAAGGARSASGTP